MIVAAQRQALPLRSDVDLMAVREATRSAAARPMTTTGYAVTAGWDVPVGDQSQVHGAVMTAETAAVRAGLRPTERAACALTATELATNLARHARGGRLVVTATDPGPYARVQLASVDDGPGIPDLPAAMADGYSTMNSLGGGLGACRRAAGAFDVYAGGTGTVVLARIGPGSRTGDGLIERRDAIIDVGIDQLAAAFRVARGSADQVADVVCEVMLRDSSREDDTCLLVCELTSDRAGAGGGPPAPTRAEPLS
jgi:anti-sigma regulatory factor (Ser/Thr protein kinase)